MRRARSTTWKPARRPTAAVLQEAFQPRGFTVTLVGGSAIEVHAPGIYRDWLERELRPENAWDALHRSDTSVTHERPLALTDDFQR